MPALPLPGPPPTPPAQRQRRRGFSLRAACCFGASPGHGNLQKAGTFKDGDDATDDLPSASIVGVLNQGPSSLDQQSHYVGGLLGDCGISKIAVVWDSEHRLCPLPSPRARLEF